MIFTTPEGRKYIVSDDLIADGGMGHVAAVVQLERDGITDDGQLGPEIVTLVDGAEWDAG
jgi:hypothetical protein